MPSGLIIRHLSEGGLYANRKLDRATPIALRHSADTAGASATFPMDYFRLADRMALMYRILYRSQQRSSRSS
nr:MAG TPA: hypothetical protein [Caudoviricetes sp.]